MDAVQPNRVWMSWISNSLLILCAFALPISTTVTDILFPIAILVTFLSHLRQETWQKLIFSPVAVSLIIFFLLFLLGTSYTIAPTHDIIHRLLQIGCLLFSALLLSNLTNERLRTWMLNAFLLAMVITLFLSYLKYYVLHIPATTRLDRADVFKDHIIQNFLMVIALFTFIYRWLNKYRFRWIYGILSLLATYNVLFLSNGRSGYFIFIALAIYTGFFYFGWRGLFISIFSIFLLIGGAFFISHSFQKRLVSIEQNTQQYHQGNQYTSVGIRIQSMKNAYHLFLQKPWVGYGTGSFATVYAALPANEIGKAGIVPLSYNNYLNVAVELGVVGLGFLIFMLLQQCRYSFYLQGEWRYFTQILLISMILGCLANPWLSDTTELHFYALFLAVGFSKLKAKQPHSKESSLTLEPSQ